jgi:hypothetical protein
MSFKKIFLLPALVLTLCTAALHAQAKLAIYGTVGAENSGLTNQGWTTAGTFGLYHTFSNHGPVALSIDARGDLSKNVNSALFGPRVALHFPIFPVKPYAELLIGAVYYSTQNGGKKDSSDFSYRWVGGLDSAILPHIDWRIVDFSYGGGLTELNRTVHMKTLSTGIVLRF